MYTMTKGAISTLTRTTGSPTPAATAWAASQGIWGRVGRPDDIGDIIAFLASDDSRWINGQILDVTGGGVLDVRKLGAWLRAVPASALVHRKPPPVTVVSWECGARINGRGYFLSGSRKA
jgi:hypothetical protein